MAFLKFEHVGKTYPNGFEAVKDFNLEVEKGDFIVFVGKSTAVGCKTPYFFSSAVVICFSPLSVAIRMML